MTALEDAFSVHVLLPELAQRNASLVFWMVTTLESSVVEYLLHHLPASAWEPDCVAASAWCN